MKVSLESERKANVCLELFVSKDVVEIIPKQLDVNMVCDRAYKENGMSEKAIFKETLF